MCHSLTCLLVAINLAVCPYLCRGVSVIACVDACCPLSTAPISTPIDDAPDCDPCEQLGSSCVCSGVPSDDTHARNMQQIAADATGEPQRSPIFLAHGELVNRLDPGGDPPPPGTPLRVRLQFWLI